MEYEYAFVSLDTTPAPLCEQEMCIKDLPENWIKQELLVGQIPRWQSQYFEDKDTSREFCSPPEVYVTGHSPADIISQLKHRVNRAIERGMSATGKPIETFKVYVTYRRPVVYKQSGGGYCGLFSVMCNGALILY